MRYLLKLADFLKKYYIMNWCIAVIGSAAIITFIVKADGLSPEKLQAYFYHVVITLLLMTFFSNTGYHYYYPSSCNLERSIVIANVAFYVVQPQSVIHYMISESVILFMQPQSVTPFVQPQSVIPLYNFLLMLLFTFCIVVYYRNVEPDLYERPDGPLLYFLILFLMGLCPAEMDEMEFGAIAAAAIGCTYPVIFYGGSTSLAINKSIEDLERYKSTPLFKLTVLEVVDLISLTSGTFINKYFLKIIAPFFKLIWTSYISSLEKVCSIFDPIVEFISDKYQEFEEAKKSEQILIILIFFLVVAIILKFF